MTNRISTIGRSPAGRSRHGGSLPTCRLQNIFNVLICLFIILFLGNFIWLHVAFVADQNQESVDKSSFFLPVMTNRPDHATDSNPSPVKKKPAAVPSSVSKESVGIDLNKDNGRSHGDAQKADDYDDDGNDNVSTGEGKNERGTHADEVDYSNVPAYVVSLILCNGDSTVGFLDAAAVLRHSVHKTSIHYPGSKGKYSYKMYAIVHKKCEQYAHILESVGYETIIRDTPIDRKEIKNEFYRNNVESENCCGSAEFIKMYAYTLTQHPVVVHFDLDKVVLQPMDDLFDAIIYDAQSPEGKSARERIEVEWPEDPLPKQIDAFFTRDYTSNWPWKKIAAVQGGLLVMRPTQAGFDQYMEVILEGNYEPGFNDQAGMGSHEGMQIFALFI